MNSHEASTPDAIHLPIIWDVDTVYDACCKLSELTGDYIEFDMLEATHSGELPANGYFGLIKDGGNVENARALGIKASVDWDDVAEWLRRRGCPVERGKWIDFTDTLERLQARLCPAPTAAELEMWAAAGVLMGYVDGPASTEHRRYHVDTEMLLNTNVDERRTRLWFDSVDVDRFEPETRYIAVEQSNVVDLFTGKPRDHEKLTGPAICLQCDYRWRAEALVGTFRLECPACRCMAGIFNAGHYESGAHMQCNCGHSVFRISLEVGAYCINCGTVCATCSPPE